jgi:hypothetical protein
MALRVAYESVPRLLQDAPHRFCEMPDRQGGLTVALICFHLCSLGAEPTSFGDSR